MQRRAARLAARHRARDRPNADGGCRPSLPFGSGIGLFATGKWNQLGAQALGGFGVAIYSFVMAFIIGWIIQKTMGFRITNEDEVAGVDASVHGEGAYEIPSTV